ALGIQRGLKSLGKSMPDDVGVIGFDGVFLDQIASPQLTTMKQKVLDMGISCVEQLMRLIEGESLKETACYFEADLVERGSTRA
ncbi:substrate-binding domain-containing protein, partial [Abiotrophia sp.]|uniref:substrate-binding domain-containing protein n=1 Tax=Abiotrophia sp. TaxID=76631 RepID=UPI001CB0B06D